MVFYLWKLFFFILAWCVVPLIKFKLNWNRIQHAACATQCDIGTCDDGNNGPSCRKQTTCFVCMNNKNAATISICSTVCFLKRFTTFSKSLIIIKRKKLLTETKFCMHVYLFSMTSHVSIYCIFYNVFMNNVLATGGHYVVAFRFVAVSVKTFFFSWRKKTNVKCKNMYSWIKIYTLNCFKSFYIFYLLRHIFHNIFYSSFSFLPRIYS